MSKDFKKVLQKHSKETSNKQTSVGFTVLRIIVQSASAVQDCCYDQQSISKSKIPFLLQISSINRSQLRNLFRN